MTCLLSEDLFFLGRVSFSLFKEGAQGHSLMVQWSELGTSTAGSWVWTLTRELRSCKSYCVAKKKKKKERKKEEERKEHNFKTECSFQFKRVWRRRQKVIYKHVHWEFIPNHPRAVNLHPSPHCGPYGKMERDGLPLCPSPPECVEWILFCRNRA